MSRISKLITAHGLVLRELDADNGATIRTLAKNTGLTERRVMEIIAELQESELVQVRRIGRRNVYTLPASSEVIAQSINKALAWEAPNFGKVPA